jgi:hypothetical protein
MIHDGLARMRMITRWIPALALVLALGLIARGQSAAPVPGPPAWPVTSAPARFIVNPRDAPPYPAFNCLELYLPDPKWAAMPIRVFTDTGVAVGSDVIWSAPGEPTRLLFDTSSGAKVYKIYVGSNWPPLHVPDLKAGVWVENRDGDGKVITSLPDMLKAWGQATKVNGRAITQAVFEGGNRFGPQTNLLTHLQGWFNLPTAQHLQFAAVSVDSTFVQIDGKEVVEWPGLHGAATGGEGPPQGAADLSAGLHQLDYYNAYVASPEGDPPLVCCLAVKGGPFADWSMLANGVPFFRPIATGIAMVYELQKDQPGGVTTGTAPPLAISWSHTDQSVIRTDLADIGLIGMSFFCLLPPKDNLVWTFDDGTTAKGQSVTHLFLRPGLRTVHVAEVQGGKEIASLDQAVGIHAEWANPYKAPELHPPQMDEALARDPTAMSASDLAGAFAVFQHYLKTDALFKLAPALTAKMSAVADPDLVYIERGAALLARDDWAHAPEAMALLHALVDRCGQGKPAPAIASEARLALARLVYKTSDKLDDVKAIVAAINPSDLTAEEPRGLKILNADLTLAAGDVPGARAMYLANTNDPTGPDVRSSIRRTAKIGQARAFIERKDYDAAEDALNQVAWQAPIEKLSPDWALTRLRLYQEENLPLEAYLWAKRLLPVLTEAGRSELLYRLTDLAYAQGDNDLAQKSLAELLQKHPYSEEAAEAKEKWPGKG